MKFNITQILSLIFFSFTLTSISAQVENVKLVQVTDAFETTEMTLAPGDYQFEIVNNGVDHEVGFVLVPKGQYDAENHIKEAYVKETVANGTSSMTSVVSLAAGEYEYFCPMNPTPKYTLTITADVETIKLTQIPGEFTSKKKMKLAAGTYQFEIVNNGVDHEVGFVLVPEGQYDAENHIKEAYVKETVANGSSSMTSLVTLEPGAYEYFCPMNPTEKYQLIVE